jgi:protein O-GlcNAc transferase
MSRKNIMPRCAISKSPAGTLQKQPTYDQWKPQMPQWLKNAETAIEQGLKEEAAEILNSQKIEEIVKQKAGSERHFILYGMAQMLDGLGQYQKAEELYNELLKTHPSAALYNKLASICEKTGRVFESVRYLAAAMQADPDSPAIWCNLGNTLFHVGETQKAIELVRKAAEAQPYDAPRHSNFLYRLHTLPKLDQQELFNEHRKWSLRHAPVHLAKTTHNNIPDPNRKLRIGYISPDFYAHAVGVFFEPLLESHNRTEVEVYGYGNVVSPDGVTEQFKSKFDHYRNILEIDDKNTAAMVEQDRIDILIDLAGHTGDNRLRVLAYNPAPIQATYLGYFETTGMEQIDYFLTDEKISPPQSQQFHTEKLFPVSRCCLCYRPLNTAVPVSPLPVAEKGYITFGMLGNAAKMNPFLVSLWTKILKNNENSRMLLMFKGCQNKEIADRYYQMFEQAGISRDRVDFSGRKNLAEYLTAYQDVDIVLDTFPYNGGTTTCDALWMGVPVISLVGEHHFSRVGLSILSCTGLEFFAASTPDEYVAKACALAAKPDALAKIRASMRARIADSSLCNTKLFAQDIDLAYRKMWHQWCRSRSEAAVLIK